MAKQTHLTNAGLKSASSYNPNQTTATILTTEVVQNHNHNHHKRPSIDHENTIRSRKISESTNHERIRRTSTSTSSTNRTNSGIGEFISSNLLQRSNFFNLALLLVISVLTNSIYFNLFYLPALHRSLDERSIKKLELPASGNSYFGLNNLLSFSSLITWPSLPFAPSESQSESGSVPAPSSAYSKLPHYRIKSFEHVAFPPLDDDQFGGSPDPSEEASYIGLLDTDAESESLKKSLETRRKESQMALKLALTMQRRGKPNKASKIFKYALSLDPRNPELLVAYGEYLERHKKDIVRAEHYYTKVVHIEPEHENAQVNLRRATPMVSKIDREMLDSLDGLLTRFYEIPSTNSALRRAKKDAYFMHIYHSNAIEGNTLNLQQTRHIIENRMAVGGKSVQEHNEVLGLDAAMRFINQTLLYKPLEKFGVEDVLEIHRRVLGFCDPIESGRFRKHQVYVGKFTPPSADHVEQLMLEFIEWLNSNQLQQAHPIQIAALVHYKFVFIHPFYDGNGRTGRLLMNLILMKFGYPPVIIRKQERLEYYEYLEMANQGDIKPFVRFIARCTQRTLQEYIKLCNDSYSISVDDSAKMFRGDLVLNTFDDDYFRDTAKTGENNNDDADDEDDGGEPVIGESFINTGKFSFLPTQDDDGEN